MVELQELYGEAALEYVEEQLCHGDELTVALRERLAELGRIYSYVPPGHILPSLHGRDFRYSTTRSIADSAWRPECLEKFFKLEDDFLSGPSRIVLIELAETQDDLSLYRTNISLNHCFINRVGAAGRTAYLYLFGSNATLPMIEEAHWQERHYPRRTVLADMGVGGRMPVSGECLDRDYVRLLASAARSLLVGAYDDETKLVCEFNA